MGEPGFTAECFQPDAFSPDGRKYKSGDRARWRADGIIEFLGRSDRQLKVRGFRIEPAEVEAILRSHPAIADACVTPHTRADGDRGLAAHVVTMPGADLAIAELRSYAGQLLPSHAVPVAWSRLDQLPLKANGKVDIAALTAPKIGRLKSPGASGSRPPDELERRLIAIWERSLDLDVVGSDDDFFELGGHSLLAVEVFDTIERAFGRRLPLSTIFEAPTVRRLAAVLREDGWEQPRDGLVTLTPTGTRPPLFFVAAGDGNSVGFGALARRLGPDQPFYGLQQRGINGGALLHTSVEAMAAYYLRLVRRVRKHGPYLLGGRCLGAFVAYEMACRLEKQGEEVALLVVLDSGGPLWRPRMLANGLTFDRAMNSALRRDLDAARKIGNVFSTEGTVRLFDWLDEPVSGTSEGVAVNRYLMEVYRMRSDLRDAFPDLTGPDALQFIEWAWRHGPAELDLKEPLLPSLPYPLPDLQKNRGRLREEVASFATLMRWRAGEALDLLTRERRVDAAVQRRERVRLVGARASSKYRAGRFGGTLTLVRSQEYRVQSLVEQWYGVDTAGIVDREVPGTHRSMMREPDVEDLATCLSDLIDQALDVSGRIR